MNKIIGLERKSGEYQGNKYDNTIIYFVTNSVPEVTGFKGGTAKVKTSLLSKITGIPVNDLGVIIDKEVDFEYDFTAEPPRLVNLLIKK